MAVPAYQNFGAPYNPPNPDDDPNNPKQPAAAGYAPQGQTAQTGDTQAKPSPQQYDQAQRGLDPQPAQPQSPTGGQTFAALQKAGIARPPMPGYGQPMTNPQVSGGLPNQAASPFTPPAFNPVNTVNPTPFGSPTNPGQPGGYTPPMTPTGNPQIPGGIPQGYTGPQTPQTDPMGQTPYGSPQTGATGLEGQLYNGWQNSGTPQQFNAQGPQSQFTGQFQPSGQNNAFNNETQAAIQQAMQNPSRYDNPALQDAFKQFSGQIDDQYNGLDQGLRGSIASRGLGSIGDSSIGTADQRFQNLQRRSAKSDMASNLLNQQAQTYGSDRAQALAMAMGYGGQQFNQGLQGFGANMEANQQNFNQGQQGFQNAYNTFGANQGAQQQAFQQKQTNLGNYLGAGQQSFNNSNLVNQQNQNQQNQQTEYLLKLLGYG